MQERQSKDSLGVDYDIDLLELAAAEQQQEDDLMSGQDREDSGDQGEASSLEDGGYQVAEEE
jgi:hypothetical protein